MVTNKASHQEGHKIMNPERNRAMVESCVVARSSYRQAVLVDSLVRLCHRCFRNVIQSELRVEEVPIIAVIALSLKMQKFGSKLGNGTFDTFIGSLDR
jgi:hypothetical protein